VRRYRVELGQQARDQLAAIEAYIGERATPEIATTIVFRRSVVIAYRVEGDLVSILNVLARGRDVEAWLEE